MKTCFAPGCALKKNRPDLISRMTAFLLEKGVIEGSFAPCCKEEGLSFKEETALIVCCPGCAFHFGLMENVRVVSLWKILNETDFPFPDYGGQVMTIHDACHRRNRHSAEMQDSARALCSRMRIALIEPALTRDETPCCGGSAKDLSLRRAMAQRRADSLPCKDVALYCTGCVRSFSVTGAVPHHLLDLLYGRKTEGLTLPDQTAGPDPGPARR